MLMVGLLSQICFCLLPYLVLSKHSCKLNQPIPDVAPHPHTLASFLLLCQKPDLPELSVGLLSAELFELI